jgi:hypothetical protein
LKGGALLAKTSLSAENYVDTAPCFANMFHFHMILCLCLAKLRVAVTNLLQKFDGGMESRMTPIQEREDDEDITMLDTPKIWSSTSYKSSPT